MSMPAVARSGVSCSSPSSRGSGWGSARVEGGQVRVGHRRVRHVGFEVVHVEAFDGAGRLRAVRHGLVGGLRLVQVDRVRDRLVVEREVQAVRARAVDHVGGVEGPRSVVGDVQHRLAIHHVLVLLHRVEQSRRGEVQRLVHDGLLGRALGDLHVPADLERDLLRSGERRRGRGIDVERDGPPVDGRLVDVVGVLHERVAGQRPPQERPEDEQDTQDPEDERPDPTSLRHGDPFPQVRRGRLGEPCHASGRYWASSWSSSSSWRTSSCTISDATEAR